MKRFSIADIQTWMASDLEAMSMQVNQLESQGMNRELAVMQIAYHFGILRGMSVSYDITTHALEGHKRAKE